MKSTTVLLLTFFVVLHLAACQRTAQNSELTARNTKASAYNVELGLAYLKRNTNERAKQKLLLALRQDPRSSMAHGALAYYYQQMGTVTLADKHYQKAISLSPNEGATLSNYGAFLCRQGDYKKAERYFDKALNDKHYLNLAEVYENAGICAMQDKRLSRAHHYFTLALAHDGQRPTSHLAIARLYMTHHQYNSAAKHLLTYSAIGGKAAEAKALANKLTYKLPADKRSQGYVRELRRCFL